MSERRCSFRPISVERAVHSDVRNISVNRVIALVKSRMRLLAHIVVALCFALSVALTSCVGSGGSVSAVNVPLQSSPTPSFGPTSSPIPSPSPSPTITVIVYNLPPNFDVPYGIANGPDGNIWFTEDQSFKVGRISPTTGQFTEYALPKGDIFPQHMAPGSDGNVWWNGVYHTGRYTFVAVVSNITPAGVVTDYRLPKAPAGGFFQTLGPDGRQWVALQTGYVAAVDTSGHAKFYSLLTKDDPKTYLNGIIPGPNHTLWVAEYGSRYVDEIDDLGNIISKFPVPDSPNGIAIGSDGNIWFASTDYDAIDSMTPTGLVTRYPLPEPCGGCVKGPLNIVAGPDGALWFTETLGCSIGQITTSGHLKEFPIITPPCGPYDIAAGSDGNLWFTMGGYSIGEVVLHHSTLQLPMIRRAMLNLDDRIQFKTLRGFARGPSAATTSRP